MAGERILVVDDDSNLRSFLGETVLPAAGFEVAIATNGQQGLETAISDPPDLIITDYSMPKKTGLEMAEALRRDGFRIPIILMTAEGSEPLAVRALRAGVMDYFIKPFEPDDLVDAVERILKATQIGGIRTDVVDQRHLQTVNVLTAIGKAVTSLLDLESILTRVVEAAVYLTGAEESVLMLRDEGTDDLYIHASKNLHRGLQNMRLKVRDSLAGQVIRTGKPLLIQEGQHKIKTAYLVKSLLYAPLKVHGETIGVLGLHNQQQNKQITERDVGAITALAEYASIAIVNARLYSASERERKRLATIFEYVGNPVMLLDNNAHLMMANTAAEEIFMVDGSAEGKLIGELITSGDLLELIEQAHFEPSVAGDITLRDERTYNTHVGQVNDMGYVIAMQDITHLKEIDRIKNDLVASLSHDLRSPLTAILSYVELMERVGEFNERQQEFARQVRGSVKSITTLINDLLELQKIEAGLDRGRLPVSLPQIARQSVQGLRGKAAVKDQTLALETGMQVPMVLGNPVRLRQVFNNLVDNALKYTPEGGKINVTVFGEDGQIVARVQDTGIGIPPDAQANVFDKFYRVDEVSESHEGTGLGLHIVATIVEAHNGRIWVESAPEQGSIFTVMLPAIDEGD